MSITICDIKVPADYCSPVIMRLAERFEAMRDQHAALTAKYADVSFELHQVKQSEERLKKQVADLKKQVVVATEATPAVVVSEISDDEIAINKFDEWVSKRLERGPGMEMRVIDAFASYKDWARFVAYHANPAPKPITKKLLVAFLTKRFGKAVDAEGKVFAGVSVKFDYDD